MSEICARLHVLFNQLERFRFPFDKHLIPTDGISIMFEQGETAHRGDRIVRVGGHRGVGALPSRLDEHFSVENKDRSIFRKNIGRSLLNRDNDPVREQWEIDLMSRESRARYAGEINRDKLRQVEQRVTEYLQRNVSFVAVPVQTREARERLEAMIISTVSLCSECRPSPAWLGLSSPDERIRESGLWQVQRLYKEPLSEQDLVQLERQLLLGN